MADKIYYWKLLETEARRFRIGFWTDSEGSNMIKTTVQNLQESTIKRKITHEVGKDVGHLIRRQSGQET